MFKNCYEGKMRFKNKIVSKCGKWFCSDISKCSPIVHCYPGKKETVPSYFSGPNNITEKIMITNLSIKLFATNYVQNIMIKSKVILFWNAIWIVFENC